jgi:hypothetical protein
MLNLSIQDVVLSIEKSPLVNLNGLLYQEYHNFFGKDFVFPPIKDQKFVKLELQETLPRMRLDYNHQLSKMMNITFMNTSITKVLSNKFQQDLKFDSCDIWVDSKGYELHPHTDDSRIKLHVQVYLSDNNQGTSLYDSSGHEIYSFPFKFNFGYALLNNQASYHGVNKVVKDGRISLYARYS